MENSMTRFEGFELIFGKFGWMLLVALLAGAVIGFVVRSTVRSRARSQP